MKKSVILLELIISLAILSIVGIYSLVFINDLYKTNTQNYQMLNNKLDLQTTHLFIENKLKSSVKITKEGSGVSFYEEDINSFKNGFYSGFIQLGKSSKEFVTTPNTVISKVDANYIWFENNNMYKIEKKRENNKIYFQDVVSQKKIYEQYKLLKGQSKIYLKNDKLMFNDSIVLNDIKIFEVNLNHKHIRIKLCKSACYDWVIKR